MTAEEEAASESQPFGYEHHAFAPDDNEGGIHMEIGNVLHVFDGNAVRFLSLHTGHLVQWYLFTFNNYS